MVVAEDCISICQLWSFVPIIEESQAAIVTEKEQEMYAACQLIYSMQSGP